ncbi:MAG TPA: hypothetical protein VGZ26_07950, partial [Pirellulales bacterium]|nr:hypothetical protein [Pirellulales bacterium]
TNSVAEVFDPGILGKPGLTEAGHSYSRDCQVPGLQQALGGPWEVLKSQKGHRQAPRLHIAGP